MRLYYSTTRQNAQNKHYSHMKEIRCIDDFRSVVSYDHVAAAFVDNCRGNTNFLYSDCSMFDVDNTHSDNPADWVTPADLQKVFTNVPFYVCYSRNHMKAKKDKAPRPKFHVYFLDVMFDDAEKYATHKRKVCEYFPVFDPNAKDAARFFFGVEYPQTEYFSGNIALHEFMKEIEVESNGAYAIKGDLEAVKKGNKSIIPEGCRNGTMYSFALSILKLLGEASGKTHQKFLHEATKCVPPLDGKELDSIWKSALKYYNDSIRNSTDYIAPEDYKKELAVSRLPLPVHDKKSFDSLCQEQRNSRILTIHGLRLLLQAFGITIRLNEMTFRSEIAGLPAKYDGENGGNLLCTLVVDIANELGFLRTHESTVNSNLDVIARDNRYHPVKELLQAVPWDGKDRLTSVYSMLNITDELDQILLHKWALQTIAVLHNTEENPISAQGVLVLQGGQGIGKTEFFRHMAIKPNFFKGGATLDMSNKDTLMSATKVWICELGELDSTTKKEQSSLKAFLTEHKDHFREPYARTEYIRPRRTSFCGTVNPKEFLRDETGNRRYWTIPISQIDRNSVFSYKPEWYAQFWRQMYSEYLSNPKGCLLSETDQAKVNLRNIEYEASLHGEDEFLTVFDIGADRSAWKWHTASEIVAILNKQFYSLHLRSQSVSKLLDRIADRHSVVFHKKTIRGRKLIHCPPAAKSIDQESTVNYKITGPVYDHHSTEEEQEVVF